MPMDTREERQSAFSFLVRAYTPGVAPSTVDAPERQAAGYVYAGILAGSPSIAPETVQGLLLLLGVGA